MMPCFMARWRRYVSLMELLLTARSFNREEHTRAGTYRSISSYFLYGSECGCQSADRRLTLDCRRLHCYLLWHGAFLQKDAICGQHPPQRQDRYFEHRIIRLLRGELLHQQRGRDEAPHEGAVVVHSRKSQELVADAGDQRHKDDTR